MLMRLSSFLFLFSCVFSQFNYQLSGGYYDQAGNTDYKYYNGGFSMTAYGDFSLAVLRLRIPSCFYLLKKTFPHTPGKIMKMIKTSYFYLIYGLTENFHLLSLLKNLTILTEVLRTEVILALVRNTD